MKKTLLLVALILLCCGIALAERPIDPYFAETRPIPVPEARPGYFEPGSSMVEVPDNIQTGEPTTFTAEAGYAHYAFSVLKLDEEAWVLRYHFFDKKGSDENTFTYTFHEPGTYYILFTATDAEGSESEEQLSFDVTGTDYVAREVSRIVSECPVSGDYEVALWLHDYLTHNAYYDLAYTRYAADGVLLLGFGVCDSYANAYGQLLAEAGIDSQRITSETHAWNAVLLEGEWYNIDCTWDDPSGETVPVSGQECYTFFGLPNEILFKVDSHQPENDEYPDCVSYACNYALRNDEMPWQPAIEEQLPEHIDAYENSFSIVLDEYYPYGDQYLMPVEPLIEYNLSRYRLANIGIPYRDHTVVFDVEYDAENDPWNMGLTVHYATSDDSRLVIPAGEIGEEAFMGTDAVSVEIDGACEAIESLCFADMPNLFEVTIPGSVETIASDAFRNAPENLLVVAAEGSVAAQFAMDNGYCLDIR